MRAAPRPGSVPLALLLALLFLLAAPAAAAQHPPRATLVVALTGDLAAGAAMRAASQVVAGASGAAVRAIWEAGAPSVQLPSGQLLLPGGMPVGLRLTFPRAALGPGEVPRLVETSRQRHAFGLLGIADVSTFKVFPFERLGGKGRRR
ncbi:MAG: hypothetical protein HY816_11870 [Candidatus Wallbacteria bacterium]|nr:hypothetical protein [Candidatus Wallbacteria bacterium]